ncbi:nicotinate-nucleotide--dimethylbenzimidazole phosphoribosyltransferase [Streptomyces sp. NPDC005202]|uniref:nicotinate-nucleotide--dimethylbenzimidazole phosphoribosyltransferase n=1 Tax=Streptomyces sp. NPDC005202 TaxID=3157021 RepID=UPI0033A555FB
MTDTGQVPGEGLPENAGMVEQPGVPAHGAYTYLSETPAEDEDLLLPGSQGAWGNEVPPPAPEPIVEAVHEPGPHETSGRDSGSVDLGAVRHPNPTPTPPAMPAAPTPPRRPLHLGPPVPDTSASPVRSLADRGPAGAPVRQSGPPTTGPEYLDVPQLREMAPQGAAPWGAQAQAAVAAPPTPVGAGAPAAETVVPGAEPGGAAQAAVARLAAQAGGAAPAAPAASYASDAGQAPQGQDGAQGPGGQDGAQAAYGPGDGQGPHGQDGAQAGQGPDGGQTGQAAEAGQATETGQGPEGASAPVGGQGPEAGYAPEGATEDAYAANGSEAAYVPQAGQAPEVTHAAGTGQGPEAAQAAETGQVLEAVHVPQAGQAPEVTHAAGTGQGPEAAQAAETGQAPEAVQVHDAHHATEAAPVPEAVPGFDAAQVPDVSAAAPAPGVPEAVSFPGAADAPRSATPADAIPILADGNELPVAGAASPLTAEAAHPVAHAEHPAEAPQPAPDAQLGQAAGEGEHPAQEAAAALAPTQGEATPAPPQGGTESAAHSADAPESTAAPAAHIPDPAAHIPGVPQASGLVAPADADPNAQAAQQSAPDTAPTPVTAEVPTADATSAPEVPQHADGTQTALPADAAHVQEAPAVQQPTAPADPHAQAAEPGAAEPGAAEPVGLAAGAEAPGAVASAGETPGEHNQGTPLPGGATLEPEPGQPLGRFVPVEGSVPTTPHLAPTPPQPLSLPAEQLAGETPEFSAAPQEPLVTVPAPRGGDTAPAAPGEELEPEVVQNADDLDTQGAEQEESTAAVAEAQQSTGPAAPGYDEAEREAVLKVMRERRDIRNGFRSDPIPHEVLLRVLEAAHTAPSVGHSQPWDFVVIRSAETRRAMHELAMRQREAYAKSLPKGRAKQFKELKIEAILDTPVNIVVTADPTRGGRHTLGRHTQPQMAPYSSALAVENLWLAARAEGLGVGWVSFFDEREMVRALGLPEHLEVVAYLCVGYVDEFPDEPELMQAGWSKRRPLSWVVHEETYGRRALPGEEPHDLLAETVAQIRPLDAKALGEAWERQKRMTKPAGALGMLEIISAQLSGLSRQCPPPIPEPAAVAIFAGDHGVHAQGVTPWPQEVTAQMVANFLGGGAVCNAFAGQVGAEVCVVDVGVASDLPATPGLLPRKVRAGTSDMTTGPAMTREEAKKAIEVGIETARDLVAAGNKALLTGEMGIANTTASAALISVFTGADPAEVTGRGTGINDETLARKTEVVRRALELHQPDPADPIGVLAAIGGFEHAAMVGLLLGGASLRTPVILDGVSAGAAALVARAIAPEVLAACIAGHRSAEPGHVAALNKLGLRPLVDLDLRLGEGTGALLALPLVQSTARAMHEVATFDSAGITEK